MTKATAEAICLETPKNPRAAMSESLRNTVQMLAMYRCRLIHRSISRPVNGKYRCWHCLREYQTGW